MLVSVIMCAYNCEKYIAQAIRSIQNQTYKHWELIISDDGSKDGTVEVIESYLSDSRIRLFKQERNIGYLKNKNFAFAQAKGDLLTQLDADDICPPQRLACQTAVFENKDINICGSNYNLIDSTGKIIRQHVSYEHDFLIEEPAPPYPFWFPGLMFRRLVVDEFGLFSDYFHDIAGDDEYWTYRVNSKYPIYFIKDVLYNYRIHSTSLTNGYDQPRSMLVPEILGELLRQRRQTGTDALESENRHEMEKFEKALQSDNKLMAEKYRQWAAKSIDIGQMKQASRYLNISFSKYKGNMQWYKTAIYFLRKRYSLEKTKTEAK